MARTKVTVRRFPAIEQSNARRSTVKPFKIKEILPQQKTVKIKKENKKKINK